MLKQYRAAVIGMVCMLAAIVATGLISLKEEQPAKDSNQPAMMAEEHTSADKEQLQEKPVLAMAGSTQVLQPVLENPGISAEQESEAETQETAAEQAAEPETTEEETTEPETTAEPSEFDGYLLPVVDVYLNIRDVPSTEGAILGKLYVGALAKIEEELDGWYKISSGTVEGYVSRDYTVTGIEAEELARQDGKMTATVVGAGLRVREEPSTDADILTAVGTGEQFEVAEELDGWVAIRYSEDTVAYLSAEFVSVEFELGEAISIEEELEAIRKAEEEAARKAAEEARAIEEAKAKAEERLANSQVIETVVTEGYNASYDDTYLLACLIHMEAGAEPYEGKLAVANVVLNRVKAGYGSTISEVIYAKNQFTGANTGALANRLAKGPNDECLQAAAEALSGVNNIGDYKNFISLGWANYDSYSEYTIIGHHCFYKR